MPQLITGDAVTLDLRLAGFASRFIALAVDLTMQIAVMTAFLVAADWLATGTGSPGVSGTLSILTMVFALIVLPTAIETVTRGRSLGKALMGLRVVRDDGGPVRMRHALVRAMAMVFVDLWTTSGVIGALACLGSRRSQRVGDMLSGTIVVGEKVPAAVRSAGQAITMPPPLAAWASSLDLVTLPGQLALNVRTFLHRYPRLDPRTRDEIAARLATEVAGYVHNPAPAGTPAAAYLAAVMAERTARSVTQLRARRTGIVA
ncbi:MAG: RDD family protein [Candidatus Nanopelagicales bacterium]